MAANTNTEEDESAIDECRRPNVDSYEILMESLRFESLTLKSKWDFDEEWLLKAEWGSRSSYTKAESKEKTKFASEVHIDFPPLISSLNKNGRPRFNLEKVRENGRLQISRVKNTRPEVFVKRTPAGADDDQENGGGRVRMKFINGDPSSSFSLGNRSRTHTFRRRRVIEMRNKKILKWHL